MKTFKKLFQFFIFNLIGFAAPSLVYWASMTFNLVDINADNFDTLSFYSTVVKDTPIPIIISQPLITWIVCMLFSFSIFFVKRKWKIIFMLAPTILPTLHALFLLIKFM